MDSSVQNLENIKLHGYRLFIVQSLKQSHVLNDRKPCVEAKDKLRRREFSLSLKVTSFLSFASRYHISIQHLSGLANVPSDLAIRNAP